MSAAQRTFVCEAKLNEAAVRNGLKRLQGKPPYGRRFCRGHGGVLQQAFLVGVGYKAVGVCAQPAGELEGIGKIAAVGTPFVWKREGGINTPRGLPLKFRSAAGLGTFPQFAVGGGKGLAVFVVQHPPCDR